MRVLGLLVGLASVALTCLGEEGPSEASLRRAFEAQFPKSEASAAALELERLAALLGVELAPKVEPPPVAESPREEREEHEDQAPDAEGDETVAVEVEERPTVPVLRVEDNRARPSVEAAAANQAVQSALRVFLEGELRRTEERVGVPPRAVERFLADHEAELTTIVSVLLSEQSLQWEMDVTRKEEPLTPNLLGQIQLQRLLVTRALLEMRRMEPLAADQTLAASWRLNEALSARPELISHLIVVAVAKYQAGAVRKLVEPAAGWADRFRSREFFLRFMAVFENTFLRLPITEGLTAEEEAAGRALGAMADELQSQDLCSWTSKGMQQGWERVLDDQFAADDPGRGWVETLALNLTDVLARWHRYLIDAELTSLVSDARAERAASRDGAWPAKLLTLGAGICPPESWAYRPSAKGTVTLAFVGALAEDESPGIRLPLTFTAGVPAAAPRRTTPAKKRVVNR